MADPIPLILACALVTVMTRTGGYLILSRFATIPPRVAAALDAVPAAVMITLVAPAAFSGTFREAAVLVLAVALGLRFGPTVTVFAAVAALIALRSV